MKEIKSILKLYNTLKDSDEKCAIAQVVRVEESSYRREGARMLVFESGVFEGGISGGCLEGDALKRSQIAILKQEPSIVTYDTSKEKEIGVGLGCNGIIDVLISPISEDSPLMAMLEKCTLEREEHIIATVTALKGSMDSVALGKSFYFDVKTGVLKGCPSGDFQDFVLGCIAEVRSRKKSGTFSYEKGEVAARVFVELIPPPYHLAIYGDNYDVYPLLELAKVMDWEVSLTGNIQKLKKEKLAPVANLYPKDDTARPGVDHRSAVLLMAHDYKTDISNLKTLIKSRAPYIGVLGPRKRFEKMLRELRAEGTEFSKEEMARTYAPCGLEIGANTPEEIAMSIISEILSAFSGKPGGMLRDKRGPIHERD